MTSCRGGLPERGCRLEPLTILDTGTSRGEAITRAPSRSCSRSRGNSRGARKCGAARRAAFTGRSVVQDAGKTVHPPCWAASQPGESVSVQVQRLADAPHASARFPRPTEDGACARHGEEHHAVSAAVSGPRAVHHLLGRHFDLGHPKLQAERWRSFVLHASGARLNVSVRRSGRMLVDSSHEWFLAGAGRGSNPRPPDYKSGALPTELSRPGWCAALSVKGRRRSSPRLAPGPASGQRGAIVVRGARPAAASGRPGGHRRCDRRSGRLR